MSELQPITSEQALVAEIRIAHSEACAAAGVARAGIQRSLSEAVRAGILLTEAKSLFGRHGRWLPWLAEHCPEISRKTAATWMRIATRASELESAASQREALSAIGLLESGRREAADPGTAMPSCQWLSGLNKAVQALAPFTSDPAQVMAWSEPERDLLKKKLAPLARLHAALNS